jgi:hypothetical protein
VKKSLRQKLAKGELPFPRECLLELLDEILMMIIHEGSPDARQHMALAGRICTDFSPGFKTPQATRTFST